MNIKKQKDAYLVESNSQKGKFYTVDPKKPFCDCPGFMFREMKRKGVCKHIKAVREFLEKKQQKTIVQEADEMGDIIGYVEKNGGEVDSIELVKKFGEDKVDEMIQLGELIEKQGKIKILK